MTTRRQTAPPVPWTDLRVWEKVFNSVKTVPPDEWMKNSDLGTDEELWKLMTKGTKITKANHAFTIARIETAHTLGQYMSAANIELKTTFQKLCAFYVSRFSIPLTEKPELAHTLGNEVVLSENPKFLMLIFNLLLRFYSAGTDAATKPFEDVTHLINHFFFFNDPTNTTDPATLKLVEDFTIFKQGLEFGNLLDWKEIEFLANLAPEEHYKLVSKHFNAPATPTSRADDGPYMIWSLLKKRSNTSFLEFFRHLATVHKKSPYTPTVFGVTRTDNLEVVVVRLLLAFYENDRTNLGDLPETVAGVVENTHRMLTGADTRYDAKVFNVLWNEFSAWEARQQPIRITTSEFELRNILSLVPMYEWEVSMLNAWKRANSKRLTPIDAIRIDENVRGIPVKSDLTWIESFKIDSKVDPRLSSVATLHLPPEATKRLLDAVNNDPYGEYDLYKVNRAIELNAAGHPPIQISHEYLRAIEEKDLSTKILFTIKNMAGK